MAEITHPKRTPKRSPLFLRGRLQGGDDMQEVRLRNISIHGARIDTSRPPTVDAPVMLICGSSNIEGKVVWIDDCAVGIEFTEPLEDAALIASLEQRMKVAAPRKYRDGRIEGLEDCEFDECDPDAQF